MSGNLTAKQKLAIETLVATGSTSETCRQVGVSRQTVYRWLAEHEFKAALGEASADHLQEITRGLESLGELAIEKIREVLEDQYSAAGVKLRAAQLVLENLLRLREMIDLEERITNLEERLK